MAIDTTNGDIAVWIGAATSVAGILGHLKFDNSVTTALTAAGVITTALASYMKARSAAKSARESEKAAASSAREVASIAATASIDNTSKSVLVQTVTSERSKWRAELRELSAELVMLLRASARSEPVEWQCVDRLRTGIRLRLNPAGRGPATVMPDKHERDREVHAALDDLHNAGIGGLTLHEGLADRLELHMAPLLKGEWEVSKDEAVTGKLRP